jgi:hypothetical protein
MAIAWQTKIPLDNQEGGGGNSTALDKANYFVTVTDKEDRKTKLSQ